MINTSLINGDSLEKLFIEKLQDDFILKRDGIIKEATEKYAVAMRKELNEVWFKVAENITVVRNHEHRFNETRLVINIMDPVEVLKTIREEESNENS